MIEFWVMRRLLAWEHPQLWHLIIGYRNAYYLTACGLKIGEAGSSIKYQVPAGACLKCLRASENKETHD